MYSSIRGALLNSNGSFVRKKRKKALRFFPLCLFGSYGRKEMGRCLKILKGWIKQSNNSLSKIFFKWIKLYIGDFSMSVVNFIWALNRDKELAFVSLLFNGPSVHVLHHIILLCTPLLGAFNIFAICPSKNKTLP